MSTNYYFIDKNKQENNKTILNNIGFIKTEFLDRLKATNLIEDENELERKCDEFYDEIIRLTPIEDEYIHICKNSMGWATLFEKTQYYSSFSQLKDFYDSNIERLIIVNEYKAEFTWDELVEVFRKEGRTGGDYYDGDGYRWARYEFC